VTLSVSVKDGSSQNKQCTAIKCHFVAESPRQTPIWSPREFKNALQPVTLDLPARATPNILLLGTVAQDNDGLILPTPSQFSADPENNTAGIERAADSCG